MGGVPGRPAVGPTTPTTSEWVLLAPVPGLAHESPSRFVRAVKAGLAELLLNRAHRFVLADGGRNVDPLGELLFDLLLCGLGYLVSPVIVSDASKLSPWLTAFQAR